ncbi:MAG: CRISPR system precrRNA processing endoribonuclease RAMP protein Cas6 [Planctomycetes bacterium]|nr:CRISPR system precrRNA processing endoribonuclease RAMP protein Cas6 [Planctomycetota bacterium]
MKPSYPSLAARLQSVLAGVRVLPRRLLLEVGDGPFSIPILRSVWGKALHTLSLELYEQVFAPPQERGESLAAGYVLRAAPRDPRFPAAADYLLFGRSVERDALLWRGWLIASLLGLGRERQPFSIHTVLALLPRGLRESSPWDCQEWALSEAAWPLEGDPAATPCRLCFAGPLRMLSRQRLVEKPRLTDLVEAAIRRVQAYHASGEDCFGPLREEVTSAAAEVPARNWHGRPADLRRYSANQAKQLEFRGVAGHLDLPSGPGAIWPLLAAAQWLHLGKATVYGLGQMTIKPLT